MNYFFLTLLSIVMASTFADAKTIAHVPAVADNLETTNLRSKRDVSYDSDAFNTWVDSFFQPFAENNNVNTIETYEALKEATIALIDGAGGMRVEELLMDALRHQCDRNTDKHLELLLQKQTCIRSLQEHKKEIVGIVPDGTVKNQVSSQLLCKVLPDLTACFEPIIEAILSCTQHDQVAMAAYQSLKTTLQQTYCQENGAAVTELLGKTPHNCISSGVPSLLKVTGPAFLRRVLVPTTEEYPCKINQYLTQASSVLLYINCEATNLAQTLSNYHQDFASKLSCHRMYW